MSSNTTRMKQWMAAARAGDLAGLAGWIAEGINVDGQGADGRTALMQAAGGHHHTCVALLLVKGANPSSRANNGNTALNYALMPDYAGLFQTSATSALPETLNLLLLARSPVDAFDVMLAAAYHHDDVVRTLARSFANSRERLNKLVGDAEKMIPGEEAHRRAEIVERLKGMKRSE